VEETVGAGWNGRGGTCAEIGIFVPKGSFRAAWEWTRSACIGGGAIFDEPQERSLWKPRLAASAGTTGGKDRANRNVSLQEKAWVTRAELWSPVIRHGASEACCEEGQTTRKALLMSASQRV
jgi:hypothetical protein